MQRNAEMSAPRQRLDHVENEHGDWVGPKRRRGEDGREHSFHDDRTSTCLMAVASGWPNVRS